MKDDSKFCDFGLASGVAAGPFMNYSSWALMSGVMRVCSWDFYSVGIGFVVIIRILYCWLGYGREAMGKGWSRKGG